MSFSFKRIRRNIKHKTMAGMALILSVAILSGCGKGSFQFPKVVDGGAVGEEIMHVSTIFAMDTVMDIQVYGGEEAEGLLADADNQIRTLEKELSVTDENSEIAGLNAAGSAELSKEPAQIMKEALMYCDSTDGALDITIYPVLRAWGFTTGEYQVPGDEEIAGLLENVDYRSVKLEEADADGSDDQAAALCTIPEGMQVDLGSVTKGYTSRKLAQYFRDNGVTSALINLGGNVECVGNKPNGSKWNVAVKSPFKDSDSGILGVIQASDEAIITSGGYERYFEENGETYWHIIDPSTGKPARNGLISVTIIGKDGLMCDALSTALFVKGRDGAIDYYRKYSAASTDSSSVANDKTANAADAAKQESSFDMILVTTEGDVYITPGASERFSLSSEYHDLSLHVLD
ncbi:FAD:protein FMN transferase [Butyrivibrio sp. INlla14]|uniref:FAD:protein FMN transferase n=1 Tax=Butyrivibrio sp. INlla14 TaxID=1520808 RepID=UPI00087648DD|nr:FAD:protein FMN transferase [Butyrivibrio sp. INlla14]SCY39914.1 thiamine biosynthesis lipoprotein [Butyrivibrio sp. INlla14]